MKNLEVYSQKLGKAVSISIENGHMSIDTEVSVDNIYNAWTNGGWTKSGKDGGAWMNGGWTKSGK